VKILTILTTILGHKTVAGRISAAFQQLPHVDTKLVSIDPQDYTTFQAPRWRRLSQPLESMYVARRKADPVVKASGFDALLVNTWELAVEFRELAKKMPTAIVVDAVPSTIDAAVRRRAGGGLKRRLAHELNQRSFGLVVPSIDYFLVKSTGCAQSLKQDFNVPDDRCIVTRAPQELELWRRPEEAEVATTPKLRLLFVGNDLVRKGGDFLIDLYKRQLSGNCVLTVVSTDPRLADVAPAEGLRLIPGLPREQLIPEFHRSDLFVFPTRQDYTPEVIAEALCSGLPCLIGDVDGAEDLIESGSNGYILSSDKSDTDWAAIICRLADHRDELNRMSVNARAFAERFLGLERFYETMRKVAEGLAAGKRRN